MKITTLEQLENAIERIDGKYIPVGAPIEVNLVDYLTKAEASDTYVTKAEYAESGGQVDLSGYLTADQIAANYVQKEAGKGLSQYNLNSTRLKKLNDIEEKAQVNVIETVKVNNTALTPTDKAVNIDLSNYLTKTEAYTIGTTVSTIEGAMWLDTSFNPPRLMLRYNGANYYTNFNAS